jgi:hypothetical protein
LQGQHPPAGKRERRYARLFHEQRTRDEAMRMEVRIATASDETLPAMRVSMDRVDEKVVCVNDKVDKVTAAVAELANEVALLRQNSDKVDTLTAAVSAMVNEASWRRQNIPDASKPVQNDSAERQCSGWHSVASHTQEAPYHFANAE